MSSVSEASVELQELFPPHQYGKQTGAIYAAYKAMRKAIADLELKPTKPLTERHTRTLYEGSGTIVRSEFMDAIREIKARQTAAKMASRCETVASNLLQIDEEFYGATALELEQVAKLYRAEIG